MSDETTLVERPRPLDPLQLLQLAIEKGVDADQLAKLVALQERWVADRAREAFAQAMQKAQAEMPAIIQDAENTHTRSRYARLEAVNKICKPVYTKHGFSVSFGTADCQIAEHVRIIADVRHAQGQTERYQGDIPLDGKGSQGGKSGMNAPQATGSTYSYGQRYLLKMIFNLTIAGEDNDAQGATLTPDQIGEINDLIGECETIGSPIDFKRFLKWLSVESLDQVPQASFVKAIHELNRKRKGGAK